MWNWTDTLLSTKTSVPYDPQLHYIRDAQLQLLQLKAPINYLIPGDPFIFRKPRFHFPSIYAYKYGNIPPTPPPPPPPHKLKILQLLHCYLKCGSL
jgi:hypothetical protein